MINIQIIQVLSLKNNLKFLLKNFKKKLKNEKTKKIIK